jgi:hypothetical protein
MKAYTHSANVIRDITEKNKGFKSAYYDYYEAHKQEIGASMKQIYSMCINIYKRLSDISKAIE